MSARRSLTRGIGELLRLLDPGLSDLVRTPQTDLDSYLGHYNTQRPHQGRMMEGQIPYSMFKKGLKLIPKEVRTKVA